MPVFQKNITANSHKIPSPLNVNMQVFVLCTVGHTFPCTVSFQTKKKIIDNKELKNSMLKK